MQPKTIKWGSPTLSLIAQKITPSATLALSARAKEMAAQGHDVIDLTVGQPDFNTPAPIVEAAFRRVREGATGYTPTPGTTELREAVARVFGEDYGLKVSLENVIVSPGAKYSLTMAMQALLGPGDKVIIPAPYWVSYPKMAAMAGADSVILETTVEDNFRLTPELLEDALDDNVKMLVLNNPSNPTGVGYNRQDLEKIASVLSEYPRVWVLCDDIYRKLVYGSFKHLSFAEVEPDISSRCVFIDGVSKAYAMTGWRIGFTVGPKELVGAMTRLQGHSTSCAAAVSQAAALEAITGDQSCVQNMLSAFSRRREKMLHRFSTIDNIVVVPPDGAFYVFANVERIIGVKRPDGEVIGDDVDLGDYLLEDALVAGVPGSAFGSPGHIRFSYAASESRIMEALDRIQISLNKLD